MAYASKAGRAVASPSNPQAQAVCSRCSMWVRHSSLVWQDQYAGDGLVNLRILVCPDCLDIPNQQLRALALPADPVPIQFAQVEPFLYDATQGQTQPYGQPVGLEPYAISPLLGDQTYGIEIPALSVVATGNTTVTVTCSAAHGLATENQISVSGLTNKRANGFFSVSVTSATVFTYATYSAISAGSLLSGHSRLVTVIVGLPRGQTTITQIAP